MPKSHHDRQQLRLQNRSTEVQVNGMKRKRFIRMVFMCVCMHVSMKNLTKFRKKIVKKSDFKSFLL